MAKKHHALQLVADLVNDVAKKLDYKLKDIVVDDRLYAGAVHDLLNGNGHGRSCIWPSRSTFPLDGTIQASPAEAPPRIALHHRGRE
jgi:hypothetical protein